MTDESLGRNPRWQLVAETAALVGGLIFAWRGWPQSWDEMDGLMVLFSCPFCVLPSVINVFAVPFLVAVPVRAWRRAKRAGVIPLGLVVFMAALGVGFVPFLIHTGDSTEFPPLPYLWCGWAMLAGAAACAAELRWRGRPWLTVVWPQCAAVPVFVLKPFTDIVFAGV